MHLERLSIIALLCAAGESREERRPSISTNILSRSAYELAYCYWHVEVQFNLAWRERRRFEKNQISLYRLTHAVKPVHRGSLAKYNLQVVLWIWSETNERAEHNPHVSECGPSNRLKQSCLMQCLAPASCSTRRKNACTYWGLLGFLRASIVSLSKNLPAHLSVSTPQISASNFALYQLSEAI